MNYIVYKTTNLVNGKIYVGVHRTENPDVFDTYLGCGVSKKNNQLNMTTGFPAAVRKYGKENFKRETLFVFPDTEEGLRLAYEKEEEIVTPEFIKREDTYNQTIGGYGHCGYTRQVKIAQYTLDGKFIRTWDGIAEAARATGVLSIETSLKGINYQSGGFQWRYFNGDTSDIKKAGTRDKPVYQFNLNGNFIKEWKSTGEAARSFKHPISALSNIYKACLCNTRSYKGYYWSYENKFSFKTVNRCVEVAKYDINGKFIESYCSLIDAANQNGIKSSANIHAAVTGKIKKCHGWMWRYFSGDKSNIEPLKK